MCFGFSIKPNKIYLNIYRINCINIDLKIQKILEFFFCYVFFLIFARGIRNLTKVTCGAFQEKKKKRTIKWVMENNHGYWCGCWYRVMLDHFVGPDSILRKKPTITCLLVRYKGVNSCLAKIDRTNINFFFSFS